MHKCEESSHHGCGYVLVHRGRIDHLINRGSIRGPNTIFGHSQWLLTGFCGEIRLNQVCCVRRPRVNDILESIGGDSLVENTSKNVLVGHDNDYFRINTCVMSCYWTHCIETPIVSKLQILTEILRYTNFPPLGNYQETWKLNIYFRSCHNVITYSILRSRSPYNSRTCVKPVWAYSMDNFPSPNAKFCVVSRGPVTNTALIRRYWFCNLPPTIPQSSNG